MVPAPPTRREEIPETGDNLYDVVGLKARRRLFDDEQGSQRCTKKQKTRTSPTDAEHVPTETVLDQLTAYQQDLDRLKRLQKLNAPFDDEDGYTSIRVRLVDYVISVYEMLDLDPLTAHTAINYLDRIFGESVVQHDERRLVAATCIWIAAKVEQSREKPEIGALAQAAGVWVEDLKAAEPLVLDLLGWRVAVATQLHFLELYEVQGVVRPSDRVEGRGVTDEEQDSVLNDTKFLSMRTLDDHSLLQYEQAVVAAAVIAVARGNQRVEPEWPLELAEAVGVSEHDLAPCRDHLCALFVHHDAPSPAPSSSAAAAAAA